MSRRLREAKTIDLQYNNDGEIDELYLNDEEKNNEKDEVKFFHYRNEDFLRLENEFNVNCIFIRTRSTTFPAECVSSVEIKNNEDFRLTQKTQDERL